MSKHWRDQVLKPRAHHDAGVYKTATKKECSRKERKKKKNKLRSDVPRAHNHAQQLPKYNVHTRSFANQNKLANHLEKKKSTCAISILRVLSHIAHCKTALSSLGLRSPCLTPAPMGFNWKATTLTMLSLLTSWQFPTQTLICPNKMVWGDALCKQFLSICAKGSHQLIRSIYLTINARVWFHNVLETTMVVWI